MRIDLPIQPTIAYAIVAHDPMVQDIVCAALERSWAMDDDRRTLFPTAEEIASSHYGDALASLVLHIMARIQRGAA